MIPLNYHHLYYFWIAAKTGKIGQASRELYLSQSGLSLQIKQLERTFRSKLLDRSHSGVKLTPEGRVAFDYCERIFSQGSELLAAFQSCQGQQQAVFRLGVAGPVSRHIVLQILKHVHSISRQVQIRIFGGPFYYLCDRLETHRLDMVVSNMDFSSQLGIEFTSRLIGAIPVCFVATPRISNKMRGFPSGLANIPVLLMPQENPVRKDVDLFLCRRKIRVSVATEIEDAELLRLMALRNEGIATIDVLTVKGDIRCGRLIKLHPQSLGIKQNIWVVYGRHPKPNPVLRHIMQSLGDHFKVRFA